MRYFWLFCALGALLGCRTVSEPSGTAIALFCSTSEQSKTDILTQDDEIAVFARIEGTKGYFLEAVKFTVKADGHSLMTAPAVAYPETNQAIHFFAYFPYHTGPFSVPTDQSQPEALKSADLCWATASTTPVAAPVALAFEHLLARLVVSANEPISGVLAYNVFSGGSLDVQTGTFIATTRLSLSTSGTELILPAQPLSRLVLTVSGVEYVFDGLVTLEAGKTTTLDLTLHPNTKTATLSGSSVTDWGFAQTEGTPSHAVSNTLLLHWPNYLPQGNTPDKVVFTINNTDYTVSSGITYANHTFTVPFTSSALRYPYTITKIAFYRGSILAFPVCTQLLGAMIYKPVSSTLGIKDQANAVRIGKLWWATGNLIADGPNGCRIGTPFDAGLYFMFGSLLGWSGGADGLGSGVGRPSLYLSARPLMFGGSEQYLSNSSGYQGAAGYSSYNFPLSDTPKNGLGDPCRFYLGVEWRTATAAQFGSLFSAGINTPLSSSNWTRTNSPVEHCYYNPIPEMKFVYHKLYRSYVNGQWAQNGNSYWKASSGSSDLAAGTGQWTLYLLENNSIDMSLFSHTSAPIRCIQPV